jgi:hypothetical protein
MKTQSFCSTLTSESAFPHWSGYIGLADKLAVRCLVIRDCEIVAKRP